MPKKSIRVFRPIVAGESRVRLEKLIQDVDALLNFLDNYPPFFEDGKSMQTDLSGILAEIDKSLPQCREMVE